MSWIPGTRLKCGTESDTATKADAKKGAADKKAPAKGAAAAGGSGVAQTGDATVVWPLIVLAIASLAAALAARRERNKN